MTTLTICVGLPASGKTSWAREQISKNPKIVRSNRDDLRLLLHEGKFSKGNEKTVTAMQHAMIREALRNGQGVICDDTNLNPRTQNQLRAIATDCRANIQVQSFTDVLLATCIERDIKRERSVGEQVIRGMWGRYLQPPPRERTGKPECVIVDVDGTLALMTSGRSPFDWARVGEDEPNPMVIEYVRWQCQQRAVVIVSGRDGCCRDDTETWILKHLDIPEVTLFMRAADDNRPDDVVKAEILDRDILPHWDPILVIDDRSKVIDMWRGLGLECWQVAPGSF